MDRSCDDGWGFVISDASSSLKSIDPWTLSAEGNFLNVSGTDRYDGGDMKRLCVSKPLAVVGEELLALPWDEGVPSLDGGVDGAGEGKWKPSCLVRTWGLKEAVE